MIDGNFGNIKDYYIEKGERKWIVDSGGITMDIWIMSSQIGTKHGNITFAVTARVAVPFGRNVAVIRGGVRTVVRMPQIGCLTIGMIWMIHGWEMATSRLRTSKIAGLRTTNGEEMGR